MEKRWLAVIVLSFGFMVLCAQLRAILYPPPPRPTTPQVVANPAAAKATLDAGLAHALAQSTAGTPLAPPPDAAKLEERRNELARAKAEAAKAAAAQKPKVPDQEIVLGDSNTTLRAVLSARHAAVRSITLNRHKQATPLEGKPDPSHRAFVLVDDNEDGLVETLSDKERYERLSYRTEVPGVELEWRLVRAEGNEVVFSAEAGAATITKRFAFQPGAYHLEHELTFQAKSGAATLDYEITGPVGVPVDGMYWKQLPFRQVVTATLKPDSSNTIYRVLDTGPGLDPNRDAAGKPPVVHEMNAPNDKRFLQFAGVMVNYFAALVIVDRRPDALPPDVVASVVPRYAGDDLNAPANMKRLQGKVGLKLVANPVKLTSQPVTHRYLLYAGPAKVLLLNYESHLGGPQAAPTPELLQLYSNYGSLYHLTALTDYPWYGWTHTLGFTTVFVTFTNVMHRLLEFLFGMTGSYGIAIILMTVIVRGLMFPISKKQAINSQQMQERMGRLKPELAKMEEKYKNDPQGRMAAQMELFRKHGVNPFSGCTGCLVVLLQMPVFMGLYYALYESSHLRLAKFLWMDNLAVPDMLAYWGNVPGLGALANLINAGPYFHLLPIVSVALMYVQQKMMMPPAMDEQQEMQMKTMNFMMLFMGYAFYWVASGLCLYFVVSSGWGLIERKFIPKFSHPTGDEPPASMAAAEAPSRNGGRRKSTPAAANNEPGLLKKLGGLWQKLVEAADQKK